MQKKVGSRPLYCQDLSISPDRRQDRHPSARHRLLPTPAHSPQDANTLGRWNSGKQETRRFVINGEPPRARTEGPRLKRAMLCQLS